VGTDVVTSVRMSPAREDALIRALYREHGEPLLAYVRGRVGGDHRRAEDIVQETMVRAWRHAGELTAETARPWLFRVARNLVVDGHRSGGRRPREVPVEAAEFVAGTEELERALLSWQVAESLRALTPAHRKVLVELYYRDRTVAETARILRVPEGTVRSRAYYALRALRLVLEESEVVSP
jgi:RNA polymerase sigma-70 factor (ECF subfamily)